MIHTSNWDASHVLVDCDSALFFARVQAQRTMEEANGQLKTPKLNIIGINV
jgi:hypothetical protein